MGGRLGRSSCCSCCSCCSGCCCCSKPCCSGCSGCSRACCSGCRRAAASAELALEPRPGRRRGRWRRPGRLQAGAPVRARADVRLRVPGGLAACDSYARARTRVGADRALDWSRHATRTLLGWDRGDRGRPERGLGWPEPEPGSCRRGRGGLEPAMPCLALCMNRGPARPGPTRPGRAGPAAGTGWAGRGRPCSRILPGRAEEAGLRLGGRPCPARSARVQYPSRSSATARWAAAGGGSWPAAKAQCALACSR